MEAENAESNPLPEPGAGSRSELHHVVAMAVPVVITTSSRALMDVTDYVMIAQLPTDDAQAAILPAQVLMWSYIVIGMGVVSLVNTYASQCLGRRRFADCSAYAWQSLYMGGLFGLPCVFLIAGIPTLVRFIGHDSTVQAEEIAYLKIALWTTAPTIASNGLGLFFIGIHRPWITMWSAIEANVINIVVSGLLIFGLLGIEPMGIAGAAWGTLFAVGFRLIRLSITMLIPSIDATFDCRHCWRPSWKKMADILRTGFPAGAQWMSEVVVWAIFVNVLVGKIFGTAELIATNIAWQFLRIAFLPSMGVGQALTALVGKSIGDGQPERAIREVRMATAITISYMGALSIIYMLFGKELVALFSSDPHVIRVGAAIMICAGIFQLFDALGITYSSALRGAGDTFIPSVFFVASTWLILVGGGWAMAHAFPQLGSLGPWLAAAALIIISAIFLWWRWNSRAWLRIDLLSPAGRSRPPLHGDRRTKQTVLVDAESIR